MPSVPADGRWSLLEVLEGFYLAPLVRWLHLEGILDELSKPRSAAELAAAHGLDPELLRLALAFVAARTELLDERDGGFVHRAGAGAGGRDAALLDQYLGAYAPLAANLPELLRQPGRGADLVDRALQARAFSHRREPGVRALPALLRELAVDRLADLGCGSGALLLALASNGSGFRGWGLDASPAMCAVARRRVAAAGLGERIEILDGRVEALEAAFPPERAQQVGAVAASSLLNETFARGTTVAVLDGIRRVFPGRPLFVADYYGRLGHGVASESRLSLLHDLVQALSGQGVPPPDRQGWQALYSAAGCRLVHAFESEGGFPWFVHLVQT